MERDQRDRRDTDGKIGSEELGSIKESRSYKKATKKSEEFDSSTDTEGREWPEELESSTKTLKEVDGMNTMRGTKRATSEELEWRRDNERTVTYEMKTKSDSEKTISIRNESDSETISRNSESVSETLIGISNGSDSETSIGISDKSDSRTVRVRNENM